MILSFATTNLFMRPFPEVLEVIAEAGFENIELRDGIEPWTLVPTTAKPLARSRRDSACGESLDLYGSHLQQA